MCHDICRMSRCRSATGQYRLPTSTDTARYARDGRSRTVPRSRVSLPGSVRSIWSTVRVALNTPVVVGAVMATWSPTTARYPATPRPGSLLDRVRAMSPAAGAPPVTTVRERPVTAWRSVRSLAATWLSVRAGASGEVGPAVLSPAAAASTTMRLVAVRP
ncbi:hypothetical protein GCM10023148_39450 [Actinokineospora soli]